MIAVNWLSDDSAVIEDLSPDAGTLFFFFGGIQGGIKKMLPFEFQRTAGTLDSSSKVFLRDAQQSWYQKGLPGIGSNTLAVADYLQGIIVKSGATKIRFVGNSMGGYAALLFCSILKTGKAVAFSPQTFICLEKRLKYGDERWPDQINRLHNGNFYSETYDLCQWIGSQYPEMKASIYVAINNKLDVAHAKELDGFENISIYECPEGGHAVSKWLRDKGMLFGILND